MYHWQHCLLSGLEMDFCVRVFVCVLYLHLYMTVCVWLKWRQWQQRRKDVFDFASAPFAAFQISLGFTSEEFPSCSVYIYLSGRRAVPEYASSATWRENVWGDRCKLLLGVFHKDTRVRVLQWALTTSALTSDMRHLRVRVEYQQQLRAIQRLSAVCDLRFIVSTSMLLSFWIVKSVGNKLSISYIEEKYHF